MRLHLAIVEAVGHQLARHSQLLLGQVLAGAEVRKDPLADRNGPFDDLFDEAGAMELKVKDVEVESTVDGAQVRHSFVEVVGEFVAMPLEDAVDRSVGQGIDQLSGLVVNFAFLLRSIVGPFAVGIADGAVVAHMPSYQNRVGSALPQLLGLSNHHVLVLQELVLRELLLLESVGGVRREDSRQPDHPNPQSTLELIQLRQLLLWQELAFSSLRTQVRSQGRGLLRAEKGQQHFRAEVELVVADCRTTVLHRIEEIIHDLPGADQRRCLNTALKLVARVQDKRVPRILALDRLDQGGHVGQPSVCVILLGVGALQGSGQGRPVDVVGGNYRNSGELRARQPEAQQQQQVDFHHIKLIQIIKWPAAMRAVRCSAYHETRGCLR